MMIKCYSVLNLESLTGVIITFQALSRENNSIVSIIITYFT